MKYRKKLEVVEALQWTGDNLEEILSFAEGSLESTIDFYGKPILVLTNYKGPLRVDTGDYIVQIADIPRQFYPCSKKDFEDKYELWEQEQK